MSYLQVDAQCSCRIYRRVVDEIARKSLSLGLSYQSQSVRGIFWKRFQFIVIGENDGVNLFIKWFSEFRTPGAKP